MNEKYQALARDASASGDRIMAENYLQHAEHYYRIIASINEAQNQSQQQQAEGRDGNRHRDGNRDSGHRENGHRDNSHRDNANRDNGHREAAHQDNGARENGHQGNRAAASDSTQPNAEAESEFGKDPRQDDARDAPAEQSNGEAVIEVIATKSAADSNSEDEASAASNGADAAEAAPKPRRRGPGRPRKSAAAKEKAAPAPEANTDGD